MKKFLEILYANYLLWRLSSMKKYRKFLQDEIYYLNNYSYTDENIFYLQNTLQNIELQIGKVLKRLEKTSIW